MEKRNHQRVVIKNLSVDASDGAGFFQGGVADASRFGIQLVDLPKKLNVQTKKLTVVVSGRGQNFKMHVRPRWASTDGVTKSIGAEILNPPWGWTEFIMAFEPKNQDDVWGTIRF